LLNIVRIILLILFVIVGVAYLTVLEREVLFRRFVCGFSYDLFFSNDELQLHHFYFFRHSIFVATVPIYRAFCITFVQIIISGKVCNQMLV
jgi:hypothetical protein